MDPSLIAAFIGILTVVASIGGAWRVVQYKVTQLEEARKKADIKADEDRKAFTIAISKMQESFSSSIDGLKETIREEIEKAINRTNNLLFQDGGRPRYVMRDDCRECNGKIEAKVKEIGIKFENRIIKLEEKIDGRIH